MAACSVFVIVTLVLDVAYASANKRLVFHSDDDVLQALSTLQTEFNTVTTKLQTEVNTLTAEVQDLSAKLQTQNSTLTAKFQAEMSSLKSTLSSVTASNIGSTYIRWGRTVCPGNDSELIYQGLMAGSKYSETGGSSKSLCLPLDPVWGKYVDGVQGLASIYGTEVDMYAQQSTTLFGKNVDNQDVPCAVCRSSRSVHVMVPARSRCYDGWTKEYAGYIMSAHYNDNNFVDYMCLDESLEFAQHGASNDDEHRLYIVEVHCGKLGSLPCPPFVDGRELSCVVCTK